MKTLSVLLLGLWSLVSAAEPLVSNVRAAQQQGTKLVDVWYDVTGVSTAVYVGLQISSNAGSTFVVPATALSGDLGANVQPGRNKHIVWNAGTDWNNQISNTMKIPGDSEQHATRTRGLRIDSGGRVSDGQCTLCQRRRVVR